jgi:hypothetical protein
MLQGLKIACNEYPSMAPESSPAGVQGIPSGRVKGGLRRYVEALRRVRMVRMGHPCARGGSQGRAAGLSEDANLPGLFAEDLAEKHNEPVHQRNI